MNGCFIWTIRMLIFWLLILALYSYAHLDEDEIEVVPHSELTRVKK